MAAASEELCEPRPSGQPWRSATRTGRVLLTTAALAERSGHSTRRPANVAPVCVGRACPRGCAAAQSSPSPWPTPPKSRLPLGWKSRRLSPKYVHSPGLGSSVRHRMARAVLCSLARPAARALSARLPVCLLTGLSLAPYRTHTCPHSNAERHLVCCLSARPKHTRATAKLALPVAARAIKRRHVR